jgi:Fic family protein
MEEQIKHESDLLEFLWQSNAIENVWDDRSFAQALKAWKYLNNQKVLTVKNILKTHDILMKYHLYPPERGAFRTVPVWIGGREAVRAVMIPGLMQIWLRQANQDKDCGQIKRSHVSFEHVHPFVDGNGRSGRLLFLWRYVKLGLPIKILYEKEKYSYYEWFNTPHQMLS